MAVVQQIESKLRDGIVTMLRADAEVLAEFPTIVGGRTALTTRGDEPWIITPQIVVRHVPNRDALERKIGVKVSLNRVFYMVLAFCAPNDAPIDIGDISEFDAVRLIELALERGSHDGLDFDPNHRVLAVGGDAAVHLDWLTEKGPVIARDTPARVTARVADSEADVADIYPLVVAYDVQINTLTGARRT